MKNLPWIVSVLFLWTTCGSAQFRVGPTAGFTFSSLRGDAPDKATYSSRPGLAAGVVADLPLTNDIILSIQPLYLQKGVNVAYDMGRNVMRDSLQLRTEYYNLMAMVKVLPDGGLTFVSAGLGFALLGAAELTDINTGAKTADVKSHFKDFDFTASLGFGIMLHAGNSLMTFELRYEQSLLSTISGDQDPSGTGLPVRARTVGLQLFAAYLISFSK